MLIVNNVAPQVYLGPTPPRIPVGPFTVTGSFSDPGPDRWTATVSYGDRTKVVKLALKPNKTFTLAHRYSKRGTYTITVKVTDSDGATGTKTMRVLVAPKPKPNPSQPHTNQRPDEIWARIAGFDASQAWVVPILGNVSGGLNAWCVHAASGGSDGLGARESGVSPRVEGVRPADRPGHGWRAGRFAQVCGCTLVRSLRPWMQLRREREPGKGVP